MTADETEDTRTDDHAIVYRLSFVGLSLLYCIIYAWMYSIISISWAYVGAIYSPVSATILAPAFIGAALLSLVIPSPNQRFQSAIVSILYFTIFLPSIITPYLQHSLSTGLLIESQIFLSGAFIIMSFLSRSSTKDGFRPRYSEIFMLSLVLVIWAGINVYVYLVFRGNLSISGLAEVYDKRFSSDYIVNGGIVVYAIANLAGAFNPFLLAVGLSKRYPILVLAAIASNILLYATLALRAHIINMVFCIALFALFSMRGSNYTKILYIFLAPLFVCMALAPFMLSYNALGGSIDQVISIIVFRTLEMPGILYGTYLEFFSIFPRTYYSHIRPIGYFIPYPYGGLQIGQVVGYYIVPDAEGLETLNVNASFIATDGIAALGLPGVLFIGGLAGMVVRLLGRIVTKIDVRLALVAMLPGVVNLSNSSLFTSALTGGGIVVTLLLALWAASNGSGIEQVEGAVPDTDDHHNPIRPEAG